MDVFARYAPFIQDFIYQNGWDSLRAVQTAAGEAIFARDDHLLLCASTASGKTEAAFFPILTLLSEQAPTSVGALYIAPLKALINDQFSRLGLLCREADIPVFHWHGDVSAAHKEKLLRNPAGILQITPESLEAMLMHRRVDLPRLFGDLRFIVIDEIHSLLRGDRGGQTLCLIQRLCRASGVDPRRIGLSATLGDPENAGRFLSAGSNRGCYIPSIAAPAQRWRLSVEHFYKGDPATATVPEGADAGFSHIFHHSRGKKCLVFANSREDCEAVTTTLRGYCELTGEPDRFLIHHGNLSASLRESAEDNLKDDTRNFSCVTTATLELGVDIGKLSRAFQLDAPFTVSAFLQRMGRTGRRGQPPEMQFICREDRPEPRAELPETLPWSLLQAVALVQLYLEDRFVEPARLDRLPGSLLYHQTMSTLASMGELSPRALAAQVLTLPVFHRVTKEDYQTLLRHLLATDQLQRTETGGLIPGLAGERQLSSFRFYGVFQESEEYTVRTASEELGTIVRPPPVGEKLAIAGHVWIVEEVDHKRRLVYCEKVRGKVPAYFGQCAGDIHTRILEKMRELLLRDDVPAYLSPAARERLTEARQAARASGMLSSPLICLGGESWCLFPWLGTYAFLALERFLKLRCASTLGLSALDSARPWYIRFRMQASPAEFYRVLRSEAEKELDPMELVYPGEVPIFEKYDEFLPPDLLRSFFARGVLDVEGLFRRIRSFPG